MPFIVFNEKKAFTTQYQLKEHSITVRLKIFSVEILKSSLLLICMNGSIIDSSIKLVDKKSTKKNILESFYSKITAGFPQTNIFFAEIAWNFTDINSKNLQDGDSSSFIKFFLQGKLSIAGQRSTRGFKRSPQ